jgi:predicted signal transduction protein with EAL and GGDEF domain
LAEYVEDEAQRSILHELGCDRYQGYLYSKAIPYEDFIEYVQELKAEHMSAEEPAVNLPSVPYIAIGKSGAITFQKYD